MEGSEWGRPPDGTWQVGRVELTPLLDHGMQKSLGSEPKGGTPQSDSHITDEIGDC